MLHFLHPTIDQHLISEVYSLTHADFLFYKLPTLACSLLEDLEFLSTDILTEGDLDYVSREDPFKLLVDVNLCHFVW